MTASEGSEGSLASRLFEEVAALLHERGVDACLSCESVPGGTSEEVVIELRTRSSEAAPCDIFVDGFYVVVSIGRGLRWEVEGSADDISARVRAMVAAVVDGAVEEEVRLDKHGTVAAAKGCIMLDGTPMRGRMWEMTRSRFRARRETVRYRPYPCRSEDS